MVRAEKVRARHALSFSTFLAHDFFRTTHRTASETVAGRRKPRCRVGRIKGSRHGTKVRTAGNLSRTHAPHPTSPAAHRHPAVPIASIRAGAEAAGRQDHFVRPFESRTCRDKATETAALARPSNALPFRSRCAAPAGAIISRNLR